MNTGYLLTGEISEYIKVKKKTISHSARPEHLGPFALRQAVGQS